MKIKYYLAILCLVSLALMTNGWAQSESVTGYYDQVNGWFVFEWDNPDYGKMRTIYDPTNKVKPLIKSKIEFDINDQDYTYGYEVTNQEGAVQLLDTLFIKHLAPIYDAKAPVSAEDWHMGEYKDKKAWQWIKTLGTPTGIPAGQTVRGFSFKSKGLPIILNAAFLGEERSEFSGPGDFDTEEVADSFERVFDSLKEKYKDKLEPVVLKTIGPTTPPTDFKPLDFVSSIINMKHEAYKLGWIKNEGIVKSLDAKLDNAKNDIEKGKHKISKKYIEGIYKRDRGAGL